MGRKLAASAMRYARKHDVDLKTAWAAIRGRRSDVHPALRKRRVVTVARRRKGGRRRFYPRRRGGRRGKHGLIFGLGIGELAMIGLTADKVLNGPSGNPVDRAMGGDFGGAGTALGGNALSNIGDIILGNVLLGVGFKLLRRFLPGKAKRFF